MKKYLLMLMMSVLCVLTASAQASVTPASGKCSNEVVWSFDGRNLTISKASYKIIDTAIPAYNLDNNRAPWNKKNLKVVKVYIESGISKIGACAFANCRDLQSVEFEGTDLVEIGWGAFLNCSKLRDFSMPMKVRKIGRAAFANCSSLSSVKIPGACRVEDQAYLSCTNLASLDIASTAVLGHYVFASEVTVGDKKRHALCTADIRSLPSNVTTGNCSEFGLSPDKVKIFLGDGGLVGTQVYAKSDVDDNIPVSGIARNDTYALIIGNEKYQYCTQVPNAIHDARVFNEYCQNTLGIPVNNIMLCENATKTTIQEEAMEWLAEIEDRADKNLIIYYAGHGVPDMSESNKAYMLPVDIRGDYGAGKKSKGIALDEFYKNIGDLAFNQTTVFLDACFSGAGRGEGVTAGTRSVEIAAEDAELTNENMIVFAAAQGSETAQPYIEKGHGLFTYFLLKKLQETGGSVSFGQLADYIQKNVSDTAKTLKLRKPQTPTTFSQNEKWRREGL